MRKLNTFAKRVCVSALFLTCAACNTLSPAKPEPAVVVKCLPMEGYTVEFQHQLADAVRGLPEGSPLFVAIRDYGAMRAADRACLQPSPATG